MSWSASAAEAGETGRVTRVPALVTAQPLAAALARRAQRRTEGDPGGRVALVTDGGSRVPAAALAAAGLEVAGLLGPDALESLAWAAEEGLPRAYADLPALLADDIDLVALDVPPPRSDTLLDAAVRAGLGVLVTVPRTEDPDRVVRALVDAEEADLPHTVAFTGRADPAYAAVAELLAGLGPMRQLTAAGWPAGGPPRAELVDLVRRWCGDVLAVCADPAAMPAPALGEDPVTLALLTETGTTVLVAERFGARQASCLLTLAGDGARLVLDGATLRTPDGLLEVGRADPASAVRLAARGLRTRHNGAASLHDLAVAGRVLAAVELSRQEGGWVELG